MCWFSLLDEKKPDMESTVVLDIASRKIPHLLNHASSNIATITMP